VATGLFNGVSLIAIVILNSANALPQIRTGVFVAYLLCMVTALVIILRLSLILAPPDGCAKCHYDIRGIESDVCPECGTEIGE